MRLANERDGSYQILKLPYSTVREEDSGMSGGGLATEAPGTCPFHKGDWMREKAKGNKTGVGATTK